MLKEIVRCKSLRTKYATDKTTIAKDLHLINFSKTIIIVCFSLTK